MLEEEGTSTPTPSGQNAVTGKRIRLLNPRTPKEEGGEKIWRQVFWKRVPNLKDVIWSYYNMYFNNYRWGLANNHRFYTNLKGRWKKLSGISLARRRWENVGKGWWKGRGNGLYYFGSTKGYRSVPRTIETTFWKLKMCSKELAYLNWKSTKKQTWGVCIYCRSWAGRDK